MAVKFSGKWFDAFKFMALVLLPALAILYGAMASVWGLPLVKEVTGTIAAVDVFLGVLLGISSSQYKQNVENPVLVPSARSVVFVHWVLWDNTYDLFMWIAQVVLPGLATFYFALALLWKLPEPEKVVTTIMALDTFLGMILGFSASQFNKESVFSKVFNSR
jgi:hypothetical protein